MKVLLKGLDCPNCSKAIEKAVSVREEVKGSSLNYITKELSVDFKENTDEESFGAWLKKFVYALEPDVEVILNKDFTERALEDSGDAPMWKTMLRRHALDIIGFVSLALSLLNKTNNVISAYSAIAAWALIGYGVLIKSARNIAKGRVFDENFLMSIATIGAICLGDYIEAAAVMAFYKAGESLSNYASERAISSIEALTKLKTPKVRLLKEGKIISCPTESAAPGDVFLVSPGEQAALDSVVIKGEGFVDTKSVTGEPEARHVEEGALIYAGYISIDAALTLEAVKKASDSMISKIIFLTKDSLAKKAKTEKLISKLAGFYTPAVVIISILTAFMPYFLGLGALGFWVRRALVFLVISCPCALVLSIPLGYFAGIGAASASGILVKGSNALENLAAADFCAFDKTGTLTKGDLEIREISAKDPEAFRVYIMAAEHFSRHPIAEAVKKHYSGYSIDPAKITSFQELAGSGVSLLYDGKSVKAGLSAFAGAQSGEAGRVYLNVDGEILGSFSFGDTIKEGAKEAIQALNKLGVRETAILSGDAGPKVERVRSECGIKTAYSGLDPKEKLEIIKGISANRKIYVGEGINDAPALAASDVGVAMGALGSDAAIEAADVVIMNDSLASLAKAVEIAKFTRSAIWQNIIGILLAKTIFLVLGALGFATMGEAVFADVGLALLSVLNVLRVPIHAKPKKLRA